MADNSLTTVDFHGAKLIARRGDTPAETLVAMKPVVEGMGLDWSAQRQKLERNPILSKGMVVITVPSRGGPQEMTALPLNRLNFWLATIQPDRVPDEATRAKVIEYQTECADALFAHFFGAVHGGINPAMCREIRTMLGITKKRLCELSGIANKTLDMFEAGRTAPEPATLTAIRRGFDRAMSEIRHLHTQARKAPAIAKAAPPPPDPTVRLQFTAPVAHSARICAYVAKLTDGANGKREG